MSTIKSPKRKRKAEELEVAAAAASPKGKQSKAAAVSPDAKLNKAGLAAAKRAAEVAAAAAAAASDAAAAQDLGLSESEDETSSEGEGNGLEHSNSSRNGNNTTAAAASNEALDIVDSEEERQEAEEEDDGVEFSDSEEELEPVADNLTRVTLRIAPKEAVPPLVVAFPSGNVPREEAALSFQYHTNSTEARHKRKRMILGEDDRMHYYGSNFGAINGEAFDLFNYVVGVRKPGSSEVTSNCLHPVVAVSARPAVIH
jgi:A49-like RNA polymerase I associated factor